MISGICVAFSMYSIFPMPQVKWEKNTMRYALCFLPLIGIIIGGLQWGWYLLCKTWNTTPIFYGIGATLLPILISGGIHIDGLADTCDALGSHADRQRKLEILKDPHIGTFGVLGISLFLLCTLAVFTQIYQNSSHFYPVIFAFIFSRASGGRTIVSLPCAKNTGLAYIFSENSERKKCSQILFLEIILFFLFFVWCFPTRLSIVCGMILFLWIVLHKRLCIQSFGGITGDLAGFSICTIELLFLTIAALGGLMQ